MARIVQQLTNLLRVDSAVPISRKSLLGLTVLGLVACGGGSDGGKDTPFQDDTPVVTTSVPQDPVATGRNGKVDLSWTAVAGATDYCVYASEGAGIHLDNAASYDMDLSGCIGSAVASHTATGLTNDNVYYFVITAIDGDSESAASNEVIATPAEPAIVTRPLNDTGIDSCDNVHFTNQICPVGGFPGQDGEYGRDALAREGNLTKAGEGAAGFDFTKLNANGKNLAVDASEWSCVHDNHTGLTWEVKTNDGGLRDRDNTYTWYNPDTATNGGGAGVQNGGIWAGSDSDTHAYVQAVNAQNLCGANDWRMPTVEELYSIIHLDPAMYEPYIDTSFFHNTKATAGHRHWSASPYAEDSDRAWSVSFFTGSASKTEKFYDDRVRLVRGRR